MTSEENRRIVKGKLARSLQEFIDGLSLESSDLRGLDAAQALAPSIAGVHPKYLDSHDAEVLLQREAYDAWSELLTRRLTGESLSRSEAGQWLFDRLAGIIEALPTSYSLKIEIPGIPVLDGATLNLADGISITRDSRGLDSIPVSPHEGIGVTPANVPRTCLQIDVSGYAGAYNDSPAYAHAISLAKQCAFVLMQSDSFIVGPSARTARTSFVNRNSGKPLRLEFPTSLARLYGGLRINGLKVLDMDTVGSGAANILTAPYRAVRTNEEAAQALASALASLTRYAKARQHDDFMSIAAAIEWFQDSQFADNQTFAFIAACIGLEALVGSDKHMDGMTQRLGDRYGFLMGKNRTERERLAEKYKAILNIRGTIVHARSPRLGIHTKALYEARSLLARAISKELGRVYRDIAT